MVEQVADFKLVSVICLNVTVVDIFGIQLKGRPFCEVKLFSFRSKRTSLSRAKFA